MSAVEWRPIPGWVGYYEASSDGQVRSVTRHRCKGRILKHGTTHNGYLTVTFTANGRRAAYTLHRVIAETFLGPKPDGLQTCHNDGDKTNCAVSNLRYATQSENELDKVRHGQHYQVNKTHCPRNHEYTPENTRIHDGNRRSCKTCHREQQRERRARMKEQRARQAERAEKIRDLLEIAS